MTVSYEKRQSLLRELAQIDGILDEIRIAIHKILLGEAQSYTINSIQVNRRALSLKDLQDLEKYYMNRRGEIEAQLEGNNTRNGRVFLPVDF